MTSRTPRGFFKNVLAIDTETSGYYRKNLHVTHAPPEHVEIGKPFEEYQILSIGLIVADLETFKTIKKLYLEIKWNGWSAWDKEAQKIHGLSKEHLEKCGVSEEEAVIAIAQFILDYWGPDNHICFAGHNVSFDIQFLDRLMSRHGIHLKISGRFIDTNTLGAAIYGTFNSDDLFDAMGFPERKKHNSLEDIEYTLEVLRKTKKLFNSFLER